MNRFSVVVLTVLIPVFALAQTKVACVGNSITYGAGISGDKTQNLLWRVRYGNYGSCKPDNVVIAIGVNNLLRGDAPEDVAEGIVAVADEAVKTFPASRVILLGLFPAGNSAKSELRKKSDRVHEQLARIDSTAFDYVNPTPWLVGADGSLTEGCYIGDGIHLSAKGYEVVAGKLREIIEWQGGYGAFSVSQSVVDKTLQYIKRQREHHRKQTFREEYIEFLNPNRPLDFQSAFSLYICRIATILLKA